MRMSSGQNQNELSLRHKKIEIAFNYFHITKLKGEAHLSKFFQQAITINKSLSGGEDKNYTN